MRIKSYYSKTITEAMERARVELGADAMIIASNRTSGETQRLGAYEVVFGLAEQTPGSAQQTLDPPPPEGLERLKNRMEDLRKTVSKKREEVSASRTPVSTKLAAALTHAGFSQQLAAELGNAAQSRSRSGKQDLLTVLRADLTGRIRVSPRLGCAGQSRSIVALVGPPGTGKTTMIAKLAVKYGLMGGRPTRLISIDTHRLGGTDLLRRYSDAMGVRFETPSNADALERCLQTEQRSELVLIDTPGFTSRDSERTTGLASLLSKRADTDVHLVLPACACPSDLAIMANRFKPFLPSKLIFTGMDDSASGGSMLAHAIETDSPISFVGCGQAVPEDLAEASAAALTARLLPGLIDAVASAA